MHRYFADWYREVSLDPDEATLEKRWAGVERFGRKRSNKLLNALSVSRMFYGLPTVPTSVRDQFIDAFKQEDSSFPIRDNDRELKLLAGATAVHLFDDNATVVRHGATLTTLICRLQGQGSDPLLADVPKLAEEQLILEQSSRRATGRAPAIPRRDQDFNSLINELQEACQNSQQPSGIASQLQQALSRLDNDIQAIYDGVRDATQSLNDELSLQREETNVLWWVSRKYSDSVDTRYEDLTKEGLPIIVGRDLAGLIGVIPGPPSVDSLLTHILTAAGVPPDETTLSLVERVQSLPDGFVDHVVEAWQPRIDQEIVLPVCGLVDHYHNTADESKALPTSVKSMDVTKDTSLTPLALAKQVYLEGMLSRLIHREQNHDG